MQIKWLDKHNGVTTNERWTGVSQTRALEMLERNDKMHYRARLQQLADGLEVHTQTYALRSETNDKFNIWE